MKSRNILSIVGIVAILFVSIVLFMYLSESRAIARIQSFDECVENGFPVQESYPRQCVTPDGRLFVESVQINQPNEPVLPTHELISVDSLRAGDTIKSPLTVTGQARGYWFFEASFPVELYNEANVKIATGIAQAQGEWMTEEFVPFSAPLTFTNPVKQNGKLIFRKDNPSGLPEHDDQFEIPVVIDVSL